jgi:hypothetical protein
VKKTDICGVGKKTAILTGDIINSRIYVTENWLSTLKESLNQYGASPNQWEVFRGDSFQLKTKPEQALQAALHIKASLKQHAKQDARIAIGIGEEEYSGGYVKESNGSAYIYSGETLEALKKQTLSIKSHNPIWDEAINLMLSLALLVADNWTKTVAKTIKVALENPTKNQTELANILGKSQSSVSEALTRGGYEEIMRVNIYYQKKLSSLF